MRNLPPHYRDSVLQRMSLDNVGLAGVRSFLDITRSSKPRGPKPKNQNPTKGSGEITYNMHQHNHFKTKRPALLFGPSSRFFLNNPRTQRRVILSKTISVYKGPVLINGPGKYWRPGAYCTYTGPTGLMCVGKVQSFAAIDYSEQGDAPGHIRGTELFVRMRPYDAGGIQKMDKCGSFIILKTAVRKKHKHVYIHVTDLISVFHRSKERKHDSTYYFVPIASARSNVV